MVHLRINGFSICGNSMLATFVSCVLNYLKSYMENSTVYCKVKYELLQEKERNRYLKGLSLKFSKISDKIVC